MISTLNDIDICIELHTSGNANLYSVFSYPFCDAKEAHDQKTAIEYYRRVQTLLKIDENRYDIHTDPQDPVKPVSAS